MTDSLDKSPYNPVKFPVGTTVKITDLSALKAFMTKNTAVEPLKPEQLNHAGCTDTVKSYGIYFGGHVLYQLDHIPGIWHQECLEHIK